MNIHSRFWNNLVHQERITDTMPTILCRHEVFSSRSKQFKYACGLCQIRLNANQQMFTFVVDRVDKTEQLNLKRMIQLTLYTIGWQFINHIESVAVSFEKDRPTFVLLLVRSNLTQL